MVGMTFTRGLALTLAAAALIALPAGPSQADDARFTTPGCVDGTELWAGNPGGLSRHQLEQRWEVVGLGKRGSVMGENGWLYPKCQARSGVQAFAHFVPGRGLVEVGAVFDD